MSLTLVTVSEVGSRDKNNPQGRKNEIAFVGVLKLIETAVATIKTVPNQWYAVGGVRQNAAALKELVKENELALAPGFRIECQISEETNTAARTRRTQVLYLRAIAV